MAQTQTSQSAPSDDVLRRIQALLDRARHENANEHEALVCMDKVQALLLQYNLDLSEIDARDDKSKRSKQTTHDYVPMGISRGRSFEWCLPIADAIAEICFCRTLFSSQARQLIFIGQPVDVEVAKRLYTWIFDQIELLCFKVCYEIPFIQGTPAEHLRKARLNGRDIYVPRGFKFREHRGVHGMRATEFYKGFWMGAAQRVSQRLRQRHREQVRMADMQRLFDVSQGLPTNTATALVLRRKEQADEYVNEVFAHAKTVNFKTKTVKHAAFMHGVAAGDQVDLDPKQRLASGN